MTNIYVADFVFVLLIFVRIVSAFFAAPVLGHKAFPALAKIFVAFLLAYVVYFSLPDKTLKIEITQWSLAANIFKEAITGLILGFSLNLVFYGVSYAGTLIGFDMELAMAEVFNPGEDVSNNAVGEVFYLGAMLVFLLINGHHFLIQALSYSFKIIPLGKFSVTKPVYDLLLVYSASVFVIAVKIASPILVSFFLVNIAEGILARIIPQMQVFFVTQPLKLIMGFLMLAFIVPVYVYVLKGLLRNFEDGLLTLIKAMGT